MGIVGVVNLSHGGVEGFETCGFRKHDAPKGILPAWHRAS